MKDLPHLGARVQFVAGDHDPFPGQTIAGEVVMLNHDAWLVAVYRDEPWRTADAAWTWLNGNSVEMLSEPPAEVEDVLYQYAVDAAAMEHTE